MRKLIRKRNWDSRMVRRKIGTRARSVLHPTFGSLATAIRHVDVNLKIDAFSRRKNIRGSSWVNENLTILN